MGSVPCVCSASSSRCDKILCNLHAANRQLFVIIVDSPRKLSKFLLQKRPTCSSRWGGGGGGSEAEEKEEERERLMSAGSIPGVAGLLLDRETACHRPGAAVSASLLCDRSTTTCPVAQPRGGLALALGVAIVVTTPRSSMRSGGRRPRRVPLLVWANPSA